MRSTVSTIILLLFATSLLQAQNFEIEYPGQTAPYVWAEINQTTDGGFIAASSGTHDFIKVDAQGQLQWGFTPPNAGTDPTDGGGVVTLDDGTMILGGELQNNAGYLTKVDANGQVIWDRIVLNGDVQGMSEGINGNFFIMAGCCGGTFQVSSYTASGSHSWSKYFHAIQSIGATSDGGVLVGGDMNGKHHVRKYDSYGDIVWTWEGTNDANNGANSFLSIVEGEDGKIYAAGSINDNGITAYVLVLDANGNFTNNHFLPFSFIQSIRKSGDGNFIIAGRKGSAYLAKMTPTGNILWDRRIEGQRANHAVPTTDGGAVALVHANGTKITKTDAQGNVFNTFIAGSLVLDQEGDCLIQNTDLPGVATVTATSTTTGKKFFASTDANGNYVLDCETSTYEITSSLPSADEPCEQTIATMVANIQTLEIGPKVYKYNADPTSFVAGHVYIDNNGDCEYDAGDTPLECVQVPITQEGEIDPIYYGETDENGYYIVEVPGDWHYFPYQFLSGLHGAPLGNGCFHPGGYVAAYDTLDFNYPLATSLTSPAYISGYVFIDENENCEQEEIEIGTDNFKVGISAVGSNDTISITPASDGYYAALVEAGMYEVFIQLEGNPNWTVCETIISVDANTTCQDLVNIPLQALTPCSDFSVSIATSLFRICDNSIIFVNYQNIGTAAATPQITVVLDTSLSYVSSEIPVSSSNGDTLIFNIDEMAPLAIGSFWISAFLDCDVVLGETHCVEATIASSTDCEDFAPLWDQSSVKITGSCEGETLTIKIENVGSGNMSQELEYIVIEDNLLLYQTPFQLNVGEFMDFPITPNGSSILVTAEQSANHPGKSMPTRAFEGCGANNQGTFSLGYITQYPQDDADTDVSIFCLENVNSYDPNDKQGFPRGVTDAHYIQANTQLEYMIRFQNTGTAPANKVLISDVIAPELNLGTLRPGASSHDYTFALLSGNEVQFTFDNINLPDSTSNLEGSQGFITFTIDQQPDNLPGTEIFNTANIFFDSNAPIQTNETAHRIPLPTIEEQQELDLCENEWNADSTYTVVNEYLFFTSVITYDVNLQPAYDINVMTTLDAGDTYNGVIYYTDTTFTEQFETVHGCDSLIHTSIEVLTSTQDLTFAKLIISPNPTLNLIHLSGLPNIEENKITLRVIDQLGRDLSTSVFIEKNESVWVVDLQNLPSGVYFLNVESEEKARTERVVKM